MRGGLASLVFSIASRQGLICMLCCQAKCPALIALVRLHRRVSSPPPDPEAQSTAAAVIYQQVAVPLITQLAGMIKLMLFFHTQPLCPPDLVKSPALAACMKETLTDGGCAFRLMFGVLAFHGHQQSGGRIVLLKLHAHINLQASARACHGCAGRLKVWRGVIAEIGLLLKIAHTCSASRICVSSATSLSSWGTTARPSAVSNSNTLSSST